MRTLGNLLWHFPFFGFVSAALTMLLGLLLMLTVVAAPIGLGLVEYGKFLLWPFGQALVPADRLDVEQNVYWKNYSLAIGILYLPLGALLAAISVVQAVGLALTIVGIVPAIVIAQSLPTYLYPVGKRCVPREVADELERRRAQAVIDRHLARNQGSRRSG